MKHIILATIGSAGDVHPIIALGTTLQQRGHRVSLITNPYFEQRITDAGLECLPLGTVDQYLEVQNNPLLWHPMKGFQVVMERGLIPAIRPLYELLREFNPTSTMIAATCLCFGARVAQEHLGFRLATLALQPSIFRSIHRSPVLPGPPMPLWMPRWLKHAQYKLTDRLVIDRLLCPPLNNIRGELGMPRIKHVFVDWLHSPDLAVGLFPEWFGEPQPDWPPQLQLTNFLMYDAGDKDRVAIEVESFLNAGEPPIVFAPGSANRHAEAFFRESVAAATQLGKRAILVSGKVSQVPDNLPPAVAWFPYVPFGSLLWRSVALVHHGGIGTTAQALTAGIPQVVMPLAHDQFDQADRVKRLGVGDIIQRKQYTAPRVANILRHMLSSADIAAQCQIYANSLVDNTGLEDACGLIENIGM